MKITKFPLLLQHVLKIRKVQNINDKHLHDFYSIFLAKALTREHNINFQSITRDFCLFDFLCWLKIKMMKT